MKTQTLLAFTAGTLLGYLFVKRNWEKKLIPVKEALMDKAESTVEKVKKISAEELKIASCEEKWNEKAKLLKVQSEALDKLKSNFIKDCQSK